jgi:long-chain acyl-CoA synthetase
MAGSGEVVTYGAYEAAADQVAQYLRSVGVGIGDHVAIFSENCPRMLEAEAGAERIGAFYTLVNSYLSAEEVAYVVDNSTSTVVFTTAAKLPVASEAVAAVGRPLHLVVMDGPGGGGWARWDDTIGAQPAEPVDGERLGAAMLYSSGTTGRPKGILRSLPDAAPDANIPAIAFVGQLWSFREGMTYLNPAPLYHSAPAASVACAIRLGAPVVVMEHFDPEGWCRLVEQHAVTHSQMVPTMFSRLLRLPAEVRSRYDLSSLERVIHAAAPCPVPVKQAMIDWLGPVVVEYYGATEANGFTFCDSAEWLAHPGTVGRPVLGTLEILDEDARECPTGVDGTVWFRGATGFTYFHDDAKTAESRDATGEASTVGDIGHVDADGYLYLTDRKSYMIISGGVNIYPQETENLLSTHPSVLDVAVIGVPNEDLGEEVKAVVIAEPVGAAGPQLEAELIDFCRAHLAHFKCPRSVDFVDELPRLPTGKLYKRVLRDRYWPARTVPGPQRTPSRSTTKTSVSPPLMTPPAPREP